MDCDYFQSRDQTLEIEKSSCVEGIGRPRVEPSFIPSVIDRAIKVPDAASFATIHFLEKLLNRKCGGSTGTNLYATFQIIAEMNHQGKAGSIVTLICDSGDRYLNTYFDKTWLDGNGFEIAPYLKQLDAFYESGKMPVIEQPQ